MALRFILIALLLGVFILWILTLLSISVFGCFFPLKRQTLQSNEVDDHDTICSTLQEKGLISEKDYNFESQVVAPLYDRYTFSGYLTIISPLLFVMKRTDYMDSVSLFFVRHWISDHERRTTHEKNFSYFYRALFKICTFLAAGLGKLLHAVKIIE